MPEKIKRVIDVHDTHYPLWHRPTWNCIFDFVKQNPPDEFIFGGDQLHLDCISHHTDGLPLYRTRRSYMSDIEGFDRDILTPLEKLLPRHCRKIWIIGNHERFEQDFLERHPELEDTCNHIRLLRLIERGWEIIPLGHAYRLGKLSIVHGEVLSGIGNQCGVFPAKKAVELYAGNVLAGHTHSPQTFTKVSPVQSTNKWQAYIAPTAGSVNPTYLRNRPTAWLNGFVTIDVFSNGQFNLYPIIVYDNRCSFAGKQYGRDR